MASLVLFGAKYGHYADLLFPTRMQRVGIVLMVYRCCLAAKCGVCGRTVMDLAGVH